MKAIFNWIRLQLIFGQIKAAMYPYEVAFACHWKDGRWHFVGVVREPIGVPLPASEGHLRYERLLHFYGLGDQS